MKNSLTTTERIERLERQNLVLKTVALLAVFVFAFTYISGRSSAKDVQLTAERFVLVNDKGTECGYFGYDAETKNPRLSLKECYAGTPEMIGLVIEKESALLKVGQSGSANATLSANRAGGSSELRLGSQNIGINGVNHLNLFSGNPTVEPYIHLNGRDKGRIEIWGKKDQFLRIQDKETVNRFLITKTAPDNIALQFFDNKGKETHRVP